MARNELGRTLQTLACAKYKVLTKTPKGREVDESDQFSFNAGFSCALAKIKIQTVANKVETTEESKETGEKVTKGRDQLCEVRFGSLSLPTLDLMSGCRPASCGS